MQGDDVVALTPPCYVDPAIAIAACGAGARGILALENVVDFCLAANAIGRLAEVTSHELGVKLGRAGGKSLVSPITSTSCSRLTWCTLACGAQQSLRPWIRRLSGLRIGSCFEAITIEEALLGERLGVDGLTLKANESGGRVGPLTAF